MLNEVASDARDRPSMAATDFTGELLDFALSFSKVTLPKETASVARYRPSTTAQAAWTSEGKATLLALQNFWSKARLGRPLTATRLRRFSDVGRVVVRWVKRVGSASAKVCLQKLTDGAEETDGVVEADNAGGTDEADGAEGNVELVPATILSVTKAKK